MSRLSYADVYEVASNAVDKRMASVDDKLVDLEHEVRALRAVLEALTDDVNKLVRAWRDMQETDRIDRQELRDEILEELLRAMSVPKNRR